MKKIICIMGKSGSGKSTLANYIKDKNPNINIIKSYTTRGVREYDHNDINTHIFKDYNFYLEQSKENKIMLDYKGVDDNNKYYHNWVSEELFLEDKVNIFVVDILAFNKLISSYKDCYDIKGVYLDLDEDIRKERIIKRGGEVYKTETHLSLSKATVEALIKLKVVSNLDLKETYSSIKGIL